MGNVKLEPTMRKRKNLLDSRTDDILYYDLYQMYMTDCRLRGIAEVTMNGYEFAYVKFQKFAGHDLRCSDITQDLINSWVLDLKEYLKPETVNSYQFKSAQWFGMA